MTTAAGDRADAAAVRFPPPLVFVLLTVVGILVDAYLAALPVELDTWFRVAGAAVLVVLALALGASATALFRRTGQDEKPWTPTPSIISTGIYSITRNPMYVSLTLLQVGIGVGLANAWVMVLALVSLAIVYVIAVRHEEAYLERAFGEAYLTYKRSVRRWI